MRGIGTDHAPLHAKALLERIPEKWLRFSDKNTHKNKCQGAPPPAIKSSAPHTHQADAHSFTNSSTGYPSTPLWQTIIAMPRWSSLTRPPSGAEDDRTIRASALRHQGGPTMTHVVASRDAAHFYLTAITSARRAQMPCPNPPAALCRGTPHRSPSQAWCLGW